MPDTGAPWNIPFLDGTELVRAYPDFSEDLADAVAAGLTAAGNAGIGSNVVSAEQDTSVTTTSSTFTSTNLSAIITPSSDASKVLVIVSLHASLFADSGRGVISEFRILRGASVVQMGSIYHFAAGGGADGRTSHQMILLALDEPASDSTLTYSVDFRTATTGNGRTVEVHRDAPSRILLAEVAA